MSALVSVGELLRRRHRGLQTRLVSLEFDPRARRARVVQLAEELVAHATVEQLVLYPYAEELLGVRDLSLEIERSLDALLAVIGGIDDDASFAGALARLTASFERHVDGDEIGLLPMVEALGALKRRQLDRLWLFVGSEGGFSDAEVQFFKEQHLPPVSLGEQILRVETACVALVSVIKYEIGALGG